MVWLLGTHLQIVSQWSNHYSQWLFPESLSFDSNTAATGLEETPERDSILLTTGQFVWNNTTDGVSYGASPGSGFERRWWERRFLLEQGARKANAAGAEDDMAVGSSSSNHILTRNASGRPTEAARVSGLLVMRQRRLQAGGEPQWADLNDPEFYCHTFS